MVTLLMKDYLIDQLEERRVWRSVGLSESGNQLGFGVMHKKDIEIDIVNKPFYFYSVVYVLRGRGKYIDENGNSYTLEPGSVFQRFPGTNHSTILDPDSNWAECYMDFGMDIFTFLENIRVVNKTTPVFRFKPERKTEEYFVNNINHLELCRESELPNLLMESINFLKDLFENRERESEVQNDIIDKSCAYFCEDLSRRINVKDYCNVNGLGYESFRKQFKKEVGISPRKYIIKRRVDLACQKLTDLNKTIGEISEELGYKTQYEFSAQFKREIGISPFKYRESI